MLIRFASEVKLDYILSILTLFSIVFLQKPASSHYLMLGSRFFPSL